MNWPWTKKHEERLITLADAKTMTYEQAIKKATGGAMFDICPINDIASAMELSGRNEAYRIIRTLHCVYFREMAPELREALPSLCRQALGFEGGM